MSSYLTKNSIAGDLLVFDELFDVAYPNATSSQRAFCRAMIMDGTISTDALTELAISKEAKIDRNPVTGMDFKDGSDAKKVTLTITKKAVNANVRSIKTKTGVLRCVVANTVKNRVDFFKIPHSVYSEYKSIFAITYTPEGEPRLKCALPYRVNSFAELCA